MKRENHIPFILFTLSVFLAMLVPMLIQDGMFLDGLVYACVSKNLANGIGSFWSLKYSDTLFSSYHEQLPLFFGIQGLFFKALGNSIYVERLCSFLMACLTGFLMIKTWRLTFDPDKSIRAFSWLPVLFWITIPVCFWAYINNAEETMMGVFATGSVYFILKGFHTGQRSFPYFLLAGLFIFLCSFCKGFQGLFPLVAIAIYWFFVREITFKRMLVSSLIVLSVPVLIYALLMLNGTASQSIMADLHNRLGRTFLQANATTNYRFYLIIRTFLELIPPLGMLILSGLIYYLTKSREKIHPHTKHAGFFLAIAMSGSFPLIITMEQRGFYLVTSLPFYATGLAILAAPFLSPLIESINVKKKAFRLFRYITIFLLFAVFAFSVLKIGKTRKDRDNLHDIYLAGNYIGHHETISISPGIEEQWSIYAYFVRHFNISLDPVNHDLEYYLMGEKETFPIPGNYMKTGLPLKKFILLRKVIQ